MATKNLSPVRSSVTPKVQTHPVSNITEEMMAPLKRMSMTLESKVDVMKSEVVSKIDQEMSDSQNAREYIAQKYSELCEKIKALSELESTVSNFRGEVKTLERANEQLMMRVESLERRNRAGGATGVESAKEQSL